MKILKMMFVKFITLSLLVTFINSADKNKGRKKFEVKGWDWNLVPQGYIIPFGLHIYVNRDQNTTHVKWMNKNQIAAKAISVIEVEHIDPATQLSNKGDVREINFQPELFRSYKRLTEALNKYNYSVELNSKVIDDLCSRFSEAIKKPDENYQEFSRILVDLEYCIDQYDNAQYFANKQGLEKVILPSLHFPSTTLQSFGILLLGSAAKCDQSVQVTFYKPEIIKLLLSKLSKDNKSFLHIIIGTITNLIRNYLEFQWTFIDMVGLRHLRRVANNEGIWKGDDRFKYKVTELLTVINGDWRELYTEVDGSNNTYAVNIEQYLNPDYIFQSGWCRIIQKYLFDTHLLSIDTVLQILMFMYNTVDKCLRVFNTVEYINKVKMIGEVYYDLDSQVIHFNNEEKYDVAKYIIHKFLNLSSFVFLIYGRNIF